MTENASARPQGAPLLTNPTPEALKARADAARAEALARAQAEREAAARAQADAQRERFQLRGSDRPADEPGQDHLF